MEKTEAGWRRPALTLEGFVDHALDGVAEFVFRDKTGVTVLDVVVDQSGTTFGFVTVHSSPPVLYRLSHSLLWGWHWRLNSISKKGRDDRTFDEVFAPGRLAFSEDHILRQEPQISVPDFHTLLSLGKGHPVLRAYISHPEIFHLASPEQKP